LRVTGGLFGGGFAPYIFVPLQQQHQSKFNQRGRSPGVENSEADRNSASNDCR